MTSKNIYTPIAPTYLYIKQHSVTGLKYLGKTTKDPYKYNGSGKHWALHIKKHGKEHIVTLWVSELFHDKSIIDYALQLSEEYNIVESKEWANMKPENGLDGNSPGATGKTRSEETKAKMSIAKKGKPKSDEHKAKLSKPKSVETRAKMSATKKSSLLSDETRAKMSIAKKGKPKSDEHKAKISAAKKDKPLSEQHKANIVSAKNVKRSH